MKENQSLSLWGYFGQVKLVMDGQLLQVCLPSHFLPESASPVDNLSPEVAESRAEVHRLQAENHKFRQQAGSRKSRHRDSLRRINALERKVEPTQMVFRALMAARTLLFSTSRGPSFSGH
jgi:hypothetical protein